MKAVILCGGLGTRIKGMVKHKPKPLIKVKGKPCVQYIIELLKKYGIEEIHANVFNQKYKMVKALIELGITNILIEPSLYGTAYAIKRLQKDLTEDFLVINGDTITNIDITDLVHGHFEQGNIATIFTHDNALHTGGVYIFSPAIFKYIPEDPDYMIPTHLIPDLIRRKIPISLVYAQKFYLDIGTPKGLRRARRLL